MSLMDVMEKAVPAWAKFTTPSWQKQGEEKPTTVLDLPPMVVREKPLVDQFRDAVFAVVREAGVSHVCPTRRGRAWLGQGFAYVYEGRGDCLVGRALIRMGVSPADLLMWEGENALAVVQYLYDGKADRSEVAAMANYAARVQVVNDSRSPWGAALALPS